MAYTYDPTTPAGVVRLTIGDTPQTVAGQTMAHFTDAEIAIFLSQNNGDPNFASVTAMRTWARSLAGKPKVQIGDYTYDPASTAANLLKSADELAKQYGDEDDDPVIGEAGGEFGDVGGIVGWY